MGYGTQAAGEGGLQFGTVCYPVHGRNHGLHGASAGGCSGGKYKWDVERIIMLITQFLLPNYLKYC